MAMRKFKHEQTESVAKQFKGNPNYYEVENSELIHKSFIENTKDWIEIFDEPKDKLYEVAKALYELTGGRLKDKFFISVFHTYLKEQGLYTKEDFIKTWAEYWSKHTKTSFPVWIEETLK